MFCDKSGVENKRRRSNSHLGAEKCVTFFPQVQIGPNFGHETLVHQGADGICLNSISPLIKKLHTIWHQGDKWNIAIYIVMFHKSPWCQKVCNFFVLIVSQTKLCHIVGLYKG